MRPPVRRMGCGASRGAPLPPLRRAEAGAPPPTEQRTGVVAAAGADDGDIAGPPPPHDPGHWRALEERARRAELENAALRARVRELAALSPAPPAVQEGGQQPPPPSDSLPSRGEARRAPVPQDPAPAQLASKAPPTPPEARLRPQQGDGHSQRTHDGGLEWGAATDGRHWSSPLSSSPSSSLLSSDAAFAERMHKLELMQSEQHVVW